MVDMSKGLGFGNDPQTVALERPRIVGLVQPRRLLLPPQSAGCRVIRDGDVESAQLAVADALRVLADGLHITTFVEGMRSPDARLLPFKKGPFYFAKDSGALSSRLYL